MPATEAVKIDGLRELSRAFAKADKNMAKDLRKSLKEAAEPVRADAARRAGTRIRNLKPSSKWSRMRTGVTQTLVYVAPQQRGTRNPSLRRTNLAGLLMDRAMQPALDAHANDIEEQVWKALDDAFDRWGRGG